MLKIMTPGPTQVTKNVRDARALETTNPDLDLDFLDFYSETCDILADILHTKHNTMILCGEGILALEAACASLTEKGDRVLVIENGVYGEGFKDFVSMYGGEPVLFSTDRERPVDPKELRAFLEKDRAFKYATLVGCDTPSGVRNPAGELCKILKEFGIISVVDVVSEMFVSELFVDKDNMDIVCGASQKALSAPSGLSLMAVSDDALKVIRNRKTPVAAFYANILTYCDYRKNKSFAYTMSASCINGLHRALLNVKEDKDIYKRHERIGTAVRKAVTAGGLKLFLKDGFSNGVTVFKLPQGVDCDQLLATIRKDFDIMLAGSFGFLDKKVIRIGHMGTNCNEKDVEDTLQALGESLKKLGFTPKCDMRAEFKKVLK